MLHVLIRPTVTLHHSNVGERQWTLDRGKAGILCHPTLSSLVLSSALVADDVAGFLHGKARTPLTRLETIECKVSQECLTAILALPTALQHLSLREFEYLARRC